MTPEEIEECINSYEGGGDFWQDDGLSLRKAYSGLLEKGISEEELKKTMGFRDTPPLVVSSLATLAMAGIAGALAYGFSKGNLYVTGIAGFLGGCAGIHGSSAISDEEDFDQFHNLYKKYPKDIEEIFSDC